MKKRSGFTLIELLIVIGIIAILAGIVIIAVNPTKQFGQANDAQRQNDVNAILNAIGQYSTAHRGALPVTLIADTTYDISNTSGAVATRTGTGLCANLVPDYLSAMPVDPDPNDNTLTYTSGDCTTYNTGYQLSIDTNGRITVTSPLAEQYDSDGDGTVGDAISVTR